MFWHKGVGIYFCSNWKVTIKLQFNLITGLYHINPFDIIYYNLTWIAIT